jgi:hypothetical protein
MSLDLQIRDQISLYLAGQIDAPDLEPWLAAVVWDIDQEPAATRRLAFDALRLTSEAANGDWSDEELRDQLKALLQMTPTVHVAPVSGEQFLEKLTEAEEEARGQRTGVSAEALMSYAHLAATAGSFGNWQSSDRGFLHQPRGESSTQPPAQAELAIS